MKAVAVLQADLEKSPLGTDSRLGAELAGVPVLTRTLRRLGAARRLQEVVVTCPARQRAAVSALVDGAAGSVRPYDGPEYPARPAVRLARKWALDSWRGGMGNSCFFDEHTHPALCATIGKQCHADIVVSVAAEAPLIDPALIDDMIAHFVQQEPAARMVFAQSPPGLTPVLFSPALLAELCSAGLAPGWANSYRPDQPGRDMITMSACYRPGLAIQTAAGRLTSDTRRGFVLLERMVGSADTDLSAEAICNRLADHHRRDPPAAPREIHIELTTEDQHARTVLRPRGAVVGRRGPLALACVQQIVDSFADYDDIRVVLGGFGEPLLHPQFGEVLGICRSAGIFGLAVRTNAIGLTDAVCQAILDHDVDVVQVLLDANDVASYQRVHGVDAWETVTANMDRLTEVRRSRGAVKPVLVATMVKARQTFDLIEPFYERWLRYSGWAVLEGYSHHAGLLPDHGVMSMAPPRRCPCLQLWTRLTVLGDGSVVACDQDFQGRCVLGRLPQQSLSEMWAGAPLQRLRTAHQQGQLSVHPMCPRCAEWHRP